MVDVDSGAWGRVGQKGEDTRQGTGKAVEVRCYVSLEMRCYVIQEGEGVLREKV